MRAKEMGLRGSLVVVAAVLASVSASLLPSSPQWDFFSRAGLRGACLSDCICSFGRVVGAATERLQS